MPRFGESNPQAERKSRIAGDSFKEAQETAAEQEKRKIRESELALEKQLAPGEVKRLGEEIKKLENRRLATLEKLSALVKSFDTSDTQKQGAANAHENLSVQEIKRRLQNAKSALEEKVRDRGLVAKALSRFAGRTPTQEGPLMKEISGLEGALEGAELRQTRATTTRLNAANVSVERDRLQKTLSDIEKQLADTKTKVDRAKLGSN